MNFDFIFPQRIYIFFLIKKCLSTTHLVSKDFFVVCAADGIVSSLVTRTDNSQTIKI